MLRNNNLLAIYKKVKNESKILDDDNQSLTSRVSKGE